MPLYDFYFIARNDNLLNVKLLGLELHENGHSWIKSHLLDKHIWFELFSIHDQRILECMIFKGEVSTFLIVALFRWLRSLN